MERLIGHQWSPQHMSQSPDCAASAVWHFPSSISPLRTFYDSALLNTFRIQSPRDQNVKTKDSLSAFKFPRADPNMNQ
jgi:hypothetical protein